MKAKQVKGRVVDDILYKNVRQAVKFYKYDGYGIKISDMHNIIGIVIETKYDGKLYTSISNLWEHGIPHIFNEDERQLILPVKYWRGVK